MALEAGREENIFCLIVAVAMVIALAHAVKTVR